VVNGGVSLTRGDAHSQGGSERLLRFVSRGEARDDDALPVLSGTLAQLSHRIFDRHLFTSRATR
jgi:hypothetical protein